MSCSPATTTSASILPDQMYGEEGMLTNNKMIGNRTKSSQGKQNRHSYDDDDRDSACSLEVREDGGDGSLGSLVCSDTESELEGSDRRRRNKGSGRRHRRMSENYEMLNGDEYGREMKRLLRSLQVMTGEEGSGSSFRRQNGRSRSKSRALKSGQAPESNNNRRYQRNQQHPDAFNVRRRFLSRNNIRPDFFCQHKLLAEFDRPMVVSNANNNSNVDNFVLGSRTEAARSSQRAAAKISLQNGERDTLWRTHLKGRKDEKNIK